MTEADCSACAQCGKTLERGKTTGRKKKYCKPCLADRKKKRQKGKPQLATVNLSKAVIELKCGHCKVAFLSNVERGFCSKRCYCKDYNKTGLRDFVCAQCHCTFSSERKRTYCGKACLEAVLVLRTEANRIKNGTNTFAGAIEARRQRSKFNFNCEHCGKAFHRVPGGHNIENGSRTRWCSMRCKMDATVKRREDNRVQPFSKYFARFCAECEKPFAALAEKVLICKECKRRRTLVIRAPCEQCGGPITGRGKKFCSKKCYRLSPNFIDGRASARKAGKLKRRGAVVTNFNPIVVLERDGWRCQICGVSTPKSRRGTNHHNAPEIDHVRPISRGGEHSMENTQCACRACNGLKSDVLVIGQIGLFSADAIAKAGIRKRSVKKWEKVAAT